MIKKILLGLGLIVFAILTFAALKSPDMKVSREIEISASPEKIFPYINHSKKADAWMSWSDGDPGMVMTYSGPDEGVGSKSSWIGKEMGVGTAEIIESIPNQVVRTKLVYTKPFEMSQLAELSLTPTEKGTLVKWSVTGQNNFMFRLMGIFINCDEMIGGEFEKGLSKLKTQLESL